MSELPCRVVGPAAGVVAECGFEVDVSFLDHAYLQLILGSRVCHDLPVVRPLRESLISYHSSEDIVVLREEGVSIHGRQLHPI